jgi:hypothetical protein
MFIGGGDRDGMMFYGDGDERSPVQRILDFAKSPWFWGPLAGLIVIIIAVIAVIKNRRDKKAVDFDE